jgi:hypothetical protein
MGAAEGMMISMATHTLSLLAAIELVEKPLSPDYSTHLMSGGIVIDGLGRGARRYLLKLVIVHVRNVYNPRHREMG